MTNLTARIEQQKEKALRFLSSHQHSNGSFDSLSTADPDDFSMAIKQDTLFANALILSCLNSVPENKISSSLANFIRSQKSQTWSFNYWIKGSTQAEQYPYPDDLDDTSCALAALYQYNPSLLDGAAMASIVQLFTATEIQPGGPYRTWLVPRDSKKVWLDVDLAVNAQVGFFFSRLGITLPNLSALFDEAITSTEFKSPYYPSPLVIMYFLSRFYDGSNKKNLILHLLSYQEASGKWENLLLLSLSLSALLHLGYPASKLTKSMEYLLQKSEQEGWKPYALYRDPLINNQPHYAGSSTLTAAFFVEAIAQYHTAVEKNLTKETPLLIAKKIESRIKKRFSILNPPFKKMALEEFSKLREKDTDNQITLLPLYFANSLSKSSKVSSSLLIRLGQISLYGWMAYTIYDDFLDEEGMTKKLPLANLALRELIILANGSSTVFSLLDRIESANFWEVTTCRTEKEVLFTAQLPDYGDYTILAERSIGHAIGPLLILEELGYESHSPEFKKIHSFFIHYLTARQLNDDAHDWKSDIEEGKLTSVVSLLLSDYKKQSNTLDIDELPFHFWKHVLPKVSKLMEDHCEIARKYLDSCTLIERPNYLYSLLEPLEKSALGARNEHQNVQQFIASY